MGHVPPGTALYNFLQSYGAYQQSTDPYRHIRTNSQNSQAYSPGMWSSPAMDLANAHWYLDGHIPSLDLDESQTINRFAWCETDNVRGTQSPFCTGLGLGDGSSWTGPPKPRVWGEIGVGFDGSQSNTGEGGARFLHNIVWAGLFTPLGTTPLEWWWYHEDATATAAKLAARKSAAAFFQNVDYAGGRFVFLMTPSDVPPGYTGETVATSDARARAFAMRRMDKKAAYVWVQHKDNAYSKASTTPTTIAPTISVPSLLAAQSYRVELWDTRTGANVSTQDVGTNSAGVLSLSVPGLTRDVAVKMEHATLGAGDTLPPAAPDGMRTIP